VAPGEPSPGSTSATQIADQYAEQRAQLVELQRVAQRDAVARAEGLRAEALRRQANEPAPAATVAARAAAPDVRAAAERAERELRQRAGADRVADAQRRVEAAQAAAAAAQATQPAAVDDRVAQRATSAPRLHEQARAEAAAHARAVTESTTAGAAPATASFTPPTPATAVSRAVSSPDVLAAIAGLPPALSALIGSTVSQRPDRAVQAIGELGEALRTVELLARSSASGAVFEATRGPRLVMPAGLGGLVSAIDRAPTVIDRPGVRPLPLLSSSALPAAAAAAPSRSARDSRVPLLPWLSLTSAPLAAAPIASTTALGATASASPMALSHVAWADRWLARFAGAAPRSLDTMNAATASSPAARLQALAQAAPDAVFVAPELPRGDLDAPQLRRAAEPTDAPSSSAAAGAPALRLVVPPAAPVASAPAVSADSVMRFDDNAETPDDVFAAISAAASRGRGAQRPTAGSAKAAPPIAVVPAAPAAPIERATLADAVAHAAPAAPGAGLSAQLAASPFAPALRHVLALPSASSFDVRSLFGSELGITYLAGLIGPSVQELSIGAQAAPTWASWSPAPVGQLGRALEGGAAEHIDRVVPGFDAAYVAPELAAEDAPDAAARAAGIATPSPSPSPSSATAPFPAADTFAASEAVAAASAPGSAAALTTLRSALLSWQVTSASEPGALQLAPSAFAGAAPGLSAMGDLGAPEAPGSRATSSARLMIEAMTLPMLSETAEPQAAWASPGMIADRAHSWSVAQERSSSDLSLDFVPPELVLAARVYGLGPAEAAQAARLAVAGAGQLGAMANTVDRTFVEAMAIGREARSLEAARRAAAGEPSAAAEPGSAASVADARAPRTADAARAIGAPGAAITTAFPTASGDIAAAIAPPGGAARAAPFTAQVGAGMPAPSNALFGVGRGTPRGAFLWPSAAVAALGMTALGSDGHLSMSVAALELLAAQVVAELGTYTALSEVEAARTGAPRGSRGFGASDGLAAAGDAGADGAAAPRAAGSSAMPVLGSAAPFGPLASLSTGAPDARRDSSTGGEPAEADVLGAAVAVVPSARRARFEALYVALGQSATGRSWSPAARAARALALAGRGDDVGATARERASAAWDVLPVVYAGAFDGAAAGAAGPSAFAGGEPSVASTSAASAAASMMASYVAPNAPGRSGSPTGRADRGSPSFGGAGDDAWTHVTVAPGLAGLSARAGEALGAYVAPAAPPSAPREQDRESTSGAMSRAPTAAPEYVQTRSGGRHGGGEVEIPPWFEAAALKMLSDRSGNEGISLAELTLINAAPSHQIAASAVAAPTAAPPSPPSAGGAPQGAAAQIDVDKVAGDVYRQILIMMDAARARNGEPYL
jgi:hypothetical protein